MKAVTLVDASPKSPYGERLAELGPRLDWPPNVWMGVSVENADYIGRIDGLRATGARVKFLSLEPLLGSRPKLDLRGIDWVIVGGATCGLAACATTAMSERQRRVAECLSVCRGNEEPQRSSPFDQHGGRSARQPSACEQRCEAMK